MKKLLLAPAVAVVAGSMTLSANVAFATTAPDADKVEQEAPKTSTDKSGEGDQPDNNKESGDDGKSGDDNKEAAKTTLKVSTKEVTPADFANKDKGVKLVVTGLKPNEKFTYSVSKQGGGGKVEDLFKEVQADKNGVWSYTVYGVDGDNGPKGFLGTYKVTVKSEEGELTDTFEVTNTPGKKDDAPKPEKPKAKAPKPQAPKSDEDDKSKEEAAKYGLKVSPKELKPADFVNKDKGVQLVVTGLKPNEKFTYSVSKQGGSGKVEDLFKEVQADKNGVWSHTVYGIDGGNGLKGFLGTYKVTVKSEEGVLTDTFKVTNTPGKKDEAKPGDKGDGKDKGGDKNDSKGKDTSSNTLPRTGMELSGLIAGGALLTVGAATVLVTRRRAK